MRAHRDPVRSLCAGDSAKSKISSCFTDMRTRVVKILTTLAQDTDTVFIFPVHDGSSDLCFAFPEGFGGKLRYFHIDLSPRFFNKISYETRLFRASRSHNLNIHSQSGLSAYLLMYVCPSNVCTSGQASFPLASRKGMK